MSRPDLDYLFAWWHESTKFISNPSQVANHPAVAEIEAHGEEAAAYIIDHLRNLVDKRDVGVNFPVWGSFGVLRRIFGESPTKPENRGHVYDVSRDWIDWWDHRADEN